MRSSLVAGLAVVAFLAARRTPAPVAALTAPGLLRPLFALLRRFAPILVLGNRAIVSRYADVVEVLTRDDAFTLSQLNAPQIDRLDGPFILGMDRSPQYERELAALRDAMRPDDLDRIRGLVVEAAARQIAAAHARGRLDVVGEYARVVAADVVAAYFGMPGSRDASLADWLRDIFHDVFVNVTGDRAVRAAALRSGNALRDHMDGVIAARRAQHAGTDDVLHRLLAMTDAHPWLDDHAVRRNLSGLIVGAVETTSKFVALALSELLRRPVMLERAREAALACDVETVKRYAYEAARFNPHTPLLVRFCARDTILAAGTPRARAIPAGTTMVLGVLSAMFDSAAFPAPGEFRIGHMSEQLHFGYGLHRCFGLLVNGVQIPELIAALVRLPGLRPATGAEGAMRFTGPFPERFVVEFDSARSAA